MLACVGPSVRFWRMRIIVPYCDENDLGLGISYRIARIYLFNSGDLMDVWKIIVKMQLRV